MQRAHVVERRLDRLRLRLPDGLPDRAIWPAGAGTLAIADGAPARTYFLSRIAKLPRLNVYSPLWFESQHRSRMLILE
jgi:hypothetical protein